MQRFTAVIVSHFFSCVIVEFELSGQNLDENVLGAVLGFGLVFHICKTDAVYHPVIPLVEFFKAVFDRDLWHDDFFRII